MALSGWFVDDIELPEAPTSDNRTISRTFQSETLFNFFPELTKPTASASDYTFTTIIYPQWKIFQLEQIAESADTDDVIMTIKYLHRGYLWVQALSRCRLKTANFYFFFRKLSAVESLAI